MRIGIIGCGYIGNVIVENFKDEIQACYDRNSKKTKKIDKSLKKTVSCTLEEFIAMDLDLVVESASVKAVREIVPQTLENGKDVLIMSVGALADDQLLSELKKSASENNCRIYIPHGAVGGLDAIRAASLVDIEKVVLITRKNPDSLGLNVIKEKTVFEGPASEAIKKFPQNVNVSVAVSIAAGKEAEVRIIADPSVDTNIHEIYLKGAFGKINMLFNNFPSENKRTSMLAALSAVNMIKSLKSEIFIY
ncbi:MAG: aspartate dehydrogenase [Euryarchaeota archaeon]|nr:aspartate dehydrogenase [Euryarchaeota archaeon]